MLMDVLDVRSPHAYIYLVLSADPSGGSVDVVGLSYLDSVDPIAAEVRVNIGSHVSRLVMRIANVTLPYSGSGNDESGSSPTVISAWEAVNLELAVKKGYVRTFEPWNQHDRELVKEIRSEFAFAVMPYFKSVK